MAEGRENQDFYYIIVDLVYKPVLFCDASGIDGTVIPFKRLHLTGSCSGMFLELIEETCQFG